MSPKNLSPIKHYRRYTDLRTQKKFYRPLYHGVELIMTQFPPTLWEHETADAAEAHAVRNMKKKRQQIARFQNKEYRTAVLVRYAALVLARTSQEEDA